MGLDGRVVRSEGGFSTGESKLSFLHGAVTATIPVPDAVLRLARERRHQFTGPTLPPPLVIDRLSRSEADFLTERGHVRFRAWGLEGDGIRGRIWVLDPDVVAAQWKPSEPAPIAPPRHGGHHRSFKSSLDADGRTLHGREVVVRLRDELGARVVVNLDASPVVVTQMGTSRFVPEQ